MTVTTILLVPTPEWREKLLADGACGARVPMAYTVRCVGSPGREPCRTTWDSDKVGRYLPCAVCGLYGVDLMRALVLAYDSALVPEGRDRAARVLAEDMDVPTSAGLHWIVWDDAWWLESPAVLSGESEGGENGQLPTIPRSVPAHMIAPWALATVCAARGLGRVVLVDAEGREVAP